MEAPPARRRLHIFNPETEMALGAGAASYCPPKAITALKKRWESLPAVWASPGDQILSTGTPTSETIKAIAERKQIEFIDAKAIKSSDAIPEPWGWNPALRRELLRAGVDANVIPNEETLNRWRELAHRRTARQFHQLWREESGSEDFELAEECKTPDEVLLTAERFGEACLKLPWSSSGRGVWFSRNLDKNKLLSIAQGAIKKQGAIMVEKEEEVVLDFATEWESRNGNCRFLGLSIFQTQGAGYSGNIAAPQEELFKIIGSSTRRNDLPLLIERQQKILNLIIAPHYEGLFGVDSYSTGDGRVNPCVEINLRRTMGHAALAWWKETGVRGLLPAIVYKSGESPNGSL